jgi:hypothetical protein
MLLIMVSHAQTSECRINIETLLFPTLIPVSGVGTTCFNHKHSVIIFTTGRLPLHVTSTLLETGVDANDCKCSREACLTSNLLETGVDATNVTTTNAAGTNSLTCLPKHGGARDDKFWSPIQRLTSTNDA